MAETTLFTNALLVDCTGADPHEGASVVVEGERIREVNLGGTGSAGGYDTVIDCTGMTLLPGLTDAHVHMGAVDVNILDQHREHPSNLVALMMARILEDTLQQGFTTVRDAGGTDWSFKAAVERGIVEGPRLLVSDRPLSQTGGHGDKRRMSETQAPEIFCPTAGMRSVVCDGADEVRRAARERLRMGADQIKVMASGGAMSPADELSATQYTLEELRAAVEEAAAARTYVMAHAYNDASVRNCLKTGVRSIEHGNLIDEETARLIAEGEAYLVPTLVTYEALSEEGRSYGVPDSVIRKIDEARAWHEGAPFRLRSGRQDRLRLGPPWSPANSQGARTGDQDGGHEPDGEPRLRHQDQRRALRDGGRDRHGGGGQARRPPRGGGRSSPKHRRAPETGRHQAHHEGRQGYQERSRGLLRDMFSVHATPASLPVGSSVNGRQGG
jgi:imidazolonepropionase-like amidohydrolase